VDFRLDAQNRPFVLEVNTNPGLYFHSAGEAGGARVVTTILERLAGGAT
jgi:D-alanine-D-alanine ligase-like ATP-grasp enzyme